MNNKLSEEQTLEDDIYNPPVISKKMFFLIFLFFILSGLFLLPWKNILQTPSLSQLLGCPVQHSPLEVSIFPLGVKTNSLTLNSQCTGIATNIVLQELLISFGGISFSPFGPVINIQVLLDDFPVQAKLAIGLNQVNFSSYYEKLAFTKITPLLKKFTGVNLLIEGNAKVDFRLSLNNQQLDEYKLDVVSTNLNLPSQMITLLKIPDLPLKNLNIKIQGKRNNLSLDNLTLGNSNNLILQSKGNFLIDNRYIGNTQLNLDLELKLSNALNKEFSILSNFIGKNKVSEGHYKMKITGDLSSPVF